MCGNKANEKDVHVARGLLGLGVHRAPPVDVSFTRGLLGLEGVARIMLLHWARHANGFLRRRDMGARPIANTIYSTAHVSWVAHVDHGPLIVFLVKSWYCVDSG